MRAVRRLLLAVLLLLAAPSAAGAKSFTAGTGQNGGIAVDDAGTVYVGWQVNVSGPGDAVQLCVVPPRLLRCGSQVTVPFPGQGYDRSRVSVLVPAPGVVDVIVPRTNGRGAFTFLARSTDGGRTFGPARQIAGDGFEQGVQGPGGRVALVTGVTLQAGLFSPAGTDAGAQGSAFGAVADGQFNDIAASGEEVLAAGSYTGTSHAYRLPAGGNPNDPEAWQQTADPAPGAASPSSPGSRAASRRCWSRRARARAQLFVQRLEGAGWSPPVAVAPVGNNAFRLLGNAKGRLTALVTDSLPYRLSYTTSTDGGVLWSSLVTIALHPNFAGALEGGMASDGRGAAVVDYSLDDKSVRVTRFSPAMAPVARRRVRGGRVQVRSVCDGLELSLVVEAARGNRRVAPGDRPAPRALRPHPRGPPQLTRPLPRRLRAAPAERPHPGASDPAPRQGAHAAPARPPLRRDALMVELNAANVLTLVRVALIPVLVAVLLSALPDADTLAAIVFVIASATDALDGWIARRRSMVTAFGKLMDPLADKLLITAALVSLVALYRLDAWVAMVIIAREFAVTGLRMLAVEQGEIISASVWGKLKTITQVAMVLALIWVDRPAPWVDVLIYVTVAITVLSGADYFYRLRNLLTDAPPPQAAPSSHSRIET